MFPTVEVRWFQQGQVDSGVQAWFHRVADHAQEQSPRVDYYLQKASAGNVGIKLREGMVEIKERCHQSGQIQFHPHVHGVVESWRKWSFPYPENLAIGQSDAFHQSWISVKKERWLCIFQINGGEIEAVPPSSRELTGGCGIELTQVEAKGELWSSVELEAFGPAEQNYDRLIATAEHIFSIGEPPLFKAQNSYAYTKWLGVLQDHT